MDQCSGKIPSLAFFDSASAVSRMHPFRQAYTETSVQQASENVRYGGVLAIFSVR